MQKGRYIEAVKVYKDDTGCGLAEAKAYIDNLRSEYGIQPQSSGQGCMVAISILIIVSSLFFYNMARRYRDPWAKNPKRE